MLKNKLIAFICVLTLICSATTAFAGTYVSETFNAPQFDYNRGTVTLSGIATTGTNVGIFIEPVNEVSNDYLVVDNLVVDDQNGEWSKVIPLPLPMPEGEYIITVSIDGSSKSGYQSKLYVTEKVGSFAFEGTLEAGQTYKAKASAYNITGEELDRDYVAIIAVYNASKELVVSNVGTPVTTVAANEYNKEIDASIVLPDEFTTGWTVKAFIWDNVDSIIPYIESISVTK